MLKNRTRTPLGIAFWIILCAYLNCAGWILSALHQLNAVGYAVILLVGAALGFVWWRQAKAGEPSGSWVSTFKARFRRSFPRAFLVLAAMAFLGGLIYPPTNYDALSYRVPRILNWLAEGQWHWIHTEFHRLNSRSVGFEWVSVPIIALTKSDRLLFLINIISYLLLPGLIYSVFTRLGVRRRVAWHWMWLLPTAYCFLLQAGSIGNDLFGAVVGLAAVDFALRARVSSRVSDVWYSCLAAALLSSGKTSNLPLLLPWAIVILPTVPLLFKKFVPSIAVGMVAVGASFLPMAALNYKYCGDWTGLATENWQTNKQSPLFFIRHNILLIGLQNVVPPVFPMAKAWNRMMMKVIPPSSLQVLETNFEPGGAHLALGEMQIEEDAGLGLGISVLLVAGVIASLRRSKAAGSNLQTQPVGKGYRTAVLMSPFISLLAFMAKSGLTTAARLLTPYYGLLIPVFLVGRGNEGLVRNVWWRRFALLLFIAAGMLLIISPARPLWPARHVLAMAPNRQNPLLQRAQSVYTVYGERANGFAPILEKLPPEATVLGLISFDDPETSLWKPFGSRRIKHVLQKDTAEDLRDRGIKYVLVSSEQFSLHYTEPFEEWLGRINAEVVQVIRLNLRASRGESEWRLVKLKSVETKKN
ncbi:hypothetical protein [Pedosphaera parvula]|uniref:Glycosyltransferase RgtA/B/C/D-like domain-containing protein n=1 Tax=Pedosphaera parvula (strain Ellin514) TaxID=320771 RepID=B9XKT0_PEDPL|nr:hypothetical protein [Pedosphaera parvula]EEF59573.1 hypothetical protein Cflav_PD2480 [Pedosphaera parvula Ellin514]